ncbi:MAG: hypothetical protein JO347_12355 [Candidatus Eremiobacteraeota bacterium]|nr:hypothetical protein [Candidatus Eremiobacteraeota bacterium]
MAQQAGAGKQIEQRLRALSVVLVGHALPEHRDVRHIHAARVDQHVLEDEVACEPEALYLGERLLGLAACAQPFEKFVLGHVRR